MNNQELEKKTEAVFRSQLYQRGYAAPADVLMDLGVPERKKYELWRRGSVPYLEMVCNTNLHRLAFIMKQIRRCAAKFECRPAFTVYKHKNQKLRFSKSGDPGIEKHYSTHYVNMAMKKKEPAEKKEADIPKK